MPEIRISIIELSENEVQTILKDAKFSRLKPESCTNCGNKKEFKRRLFQVKGIPKDMRDDDDTHNIVAYHMKRNRSIEIVFFKHFGRKFIVDTAECSKCQSTAITYDIDFDDDLISMIAKTTGKSESQTRKELMERFEKRKDDR
jgi:hypothetical protein